MIHLPQLPGYSGDTPRQSQIDELTQQGTKNLKILADAGFQSAAVENHGDNPPPNPDHPMPPGVSEALLHVLIALKREANALHMELGLNLVYDMEAALRLAHAAKLNFLRLDIFVDAIRQDARNFTITNPPAEALARLRSQLEKQCGHKLSLLVDVHPKHFTMLDPSKTITESVHEAESHGADAIVITGSWTGIAVDLNDLHEAKKAAGVAVFVGSGCNEETIRTVLGVADGAIVGTSIKVNQDLHGYDVDPVLAARLVGRANG